MPGAPVVLRIKQATAFEANSPTMCKGTRVLPKQIPYGAQSEKNPPVGLNVHVLRIASNRILDPDVARDAQHRVVEMILAREREATEKELPLILDKAKSAE